MAWIYLVIAGIFEWGWPVGLKLGVSDDAFNWYWLAFAGVCMAISGALLLIAQKTIPIGTAYAVWTGIGAHIPHARSKQNDILSQQIATSFQ
jgi:quaternary ammonium compound-resistance protein SugE